MDDSFGAAERFLLTEARVLERRLFATLFRDAPASGVVAALGAYRNTDGGFGHGLEPDKRTPDSLPVDVEFTFQALATAGVAAPELIGPACDYLARVATGGAVPLAFPVIEAYPRAVHWSEWTYEPGLNPTAGLCGLLYQLGYEHPWRDAATDYCWRALESAPLPDEVHALAEVFVFLEHVPDRNRADKLAPAVLERITGSEMFHLEPDATGYGLSPLTIVSAPDSRWRSLFTDAQIDGHLDHLAQAQQADGGWPITWDPPSEASRLEWRGIVTLQSLRRLRSFGRL
jgi:hypothetical protein